LARFSCVTCSFIYYSFINLVVLIGPVGNV
jgi:hypothetical protein